MKINSYLYLFLLLQTGLLCAQDFTPGYLITKDQDTLNGFIINKTDAHLASGIQFKKGMEGPVVNYEPGDLEAFGFSTGRFFESMEVPSGEQEKTKQVFAKNIIRGEIDLYVWRHEGRSKPDFFVHNNSTGNRAYLKKPEKRDVVQGGKSYKTEDQFYLGSLNLVKGEAGKNSKPRFSEKRIKKDIISYNSNFEQDVPLLIYEDEVTYNYDLMVGMPIFEDLIYPVWRVSAFMNKNRPERTRSFFYTYGIYFEHIDKSKRELPTNMRNGGIDHKRNTLNIMPIAFKYQLNGKVFQPYGYLGGGITARWMTWLMIEDFNEAGTRTDIAVYPTLNVGVGTKIKMGPAAFIAEITPSMRGIFLNAGISF